MKNITIFKPRKHNQKVPKIQFWQKKWVKVTVSSFIGLGVLVGLTSIGAYAYVAKDLPSIVNLEDRKIAQSTQIYDRTNTVLLYEISGEENRTIIPEDEIPDSIKQAFIAIEDREFYTHFGVRPVAIVRAAFQNITGQGIGGGASTITQQFVKNALLTNDRSLIRKIREAILAIQIEQRYSKDEILSFYLNEIPFGGNIYGIEAASQTFFGKKARDIEPYQAAMLAAIVQRPTYYSPYGSNFEALKDRQKFVLSAMRDEQFLTQEAYESEINKELVVLPFTQNIKAPHFVFYVREKLAQLLGEEELEQGGFRVQTTLDWELQQIAEKDVAEELAKNTGRYDAQNAALGAIDPSNGDILVMVGSKDYFNTDADGNVNILTTQQSPGSSIKPIVYAEAFSKGLNPESYVFDLPTNFEVNPGLPAYEPNNFNLQFNGPVSLRRALATSLNVPAVKMLYVAGIKDTLELANNLGISDYSPDKTVGLAMALGGVDLKLIEHFGAYAVFPNEGKFNPITPLMKITRNNGEVAYSWEKEEKEVLDINVARGITNILSDNGARSPVFGFTNNLSIPGVDVAAKTGTSQEFRDALTVGYTTNLVVGVWVGKNDNSPMRNGADGSVVAAPIWNRFMRNAIAVRSPEKFSAPIIPKGQKPMVDTGGFEYIKKVKINRITGKLANTQTPPELVVEREYKEVHSLLYYIDKNDIKGPWPKNPSNDPQFANWEKSVRTWASGRGYSEAPPTEEDSIYTDDNKPKITINSPQNADTFVGTTIPLNVSVSANQGVQQVDVYVDDTSVFSTQSASFTTSIPVDPGEKKLIIRAFDPFLNRSEESITVTVKGDGVAPVISSWSVGGNRVSGFVLTADISDSVGKVSRVEFLESKLGVIHATTQSTSGTTYTYTYNPPVGETNWNFSIIATDDSGNKVTSNTLSKP